MAELLTLASVAIVVLGALATLFHNALQAGKAERNTMRAYFAEERKAWADERSILITRIQDPIAGMSQAYAQMDQPPAPDPDVVPDYRF